MSPADRLLDRREMAADVYMPVAIRTLTLIIVLAVLYIIAGPGGLFPDFRQLLAPFFVPVAASAIVWYLGTLVPIIIRGPHGRGRAGRLRGDGDRAVRRPHLFLVLRLQHLFPADIAHQEAP